MNTEQFSRKEKESHRRDAETAEVPGSARFQRALGVQHPARRVRALPGARRGKSLIFFVKFVEFVAVFTD